MGSAPSIYELGSNISGSVHRSRGSAAKRNERARASVELRSLFHGGEAATVVRLWSSGLPLEEHTRNCTILGNSPSE